MRNDVYMCEMASLFEKRLKCVGNDVIIIIIIIMVVPRSRG